MNSDHKRRIVRRIFILGVVNLITSIISIAIGAVAVNTSNSDFPYKAGGGIIGGSFAIFLSCCPIGIYLGYKQNSNHDADCCLLCMVIYFGVAVLALPLAIGLTGIYGLVECNKPDGGEYCDVNKDSKVAMCILTLIVSFILLVVQLAIFFSCCCNANSAFDIPLLHSSSYGQSYAGSYGYASSSSTNNVRQIREMDRERAQRRTLPPPLSLISSNIDHDVYNDTGQSVVEQGTTEPSEQGTTEPSAPDLNVDFQAEFREHMTRDDTRLDDPPPSYDEVMGTSPAGTIV